MQMASRAMLCSKHDTVVTVTGDLELDSLLQGTCPMGGETVFYETGGGPATPQAGVGGVHDPMHGVALSPPGNLPAETAPTEWDAPKQDWSASPATAAMEPGVISDTGDVTRYDADGKLLGPEKWTAAEDANASAPATSTLPEDHPPLVPPV